MNLSPIISLYISIISPYILHLIDNKGSLMVFVKSHLPSRRPNTNYTFWNKPQKRKMVSCINLHHSIPEKQIFSLVFTRILLNLKKFIILGGFNINAFYNIMKQNTCFKGDGGLCIDLLITNSKFPFMKTNPFETGLSDHHHTTYTFLKTKFEKFEPKMLI